MKNPKHHSYAALAPDVRRRTYLVVVRELNRLDRECYARLAALEQQLASTDFQNMIFYKNNMLDVLKLHFKLRGMYLVPHKEESNRISRRARVEREAALLARRLRVPLKATRYELLAQMRNFI